MQHITQHFDAFINCRSKEYFRRQGNIGHSSGYGQILAELDSNYRQQFVSCLRLAHGSHEIVDRPVDLADAITHGYQLILNASVTHEALSITFDVLERVCEESSGIFHYVPLLLIHREKLSRLDKVLASFQAITLARAVGVPLTYGKIVRGDNSRVTKVVLATSKGLTQIALHTQRLIGEFVTQMKCDAPPPLTLNDHCAVCEFRERCRAAAVEKDDISLLTGLSVGEVCALRERGIFTVKQLSYTFRAKTVTGKRQAGRHLPALQALAIRENKVYMVRQPSLPATGVRVFLDVEGVPDRDFYYLIGVVTEENDSVQTSSFWADSPHDEQTIWRNLLTFLSGISEFTVFHYGRYERIFFDHMVNRYGVPAERKGLAEILITRSVDVLSSISGGVYFPAHNKSLKTIAALFGATWSDEKASGLQSLAWRHEWDASQDVAVKNALVRYNEEDCLALRKLTDVLGQFSQGRAGNLEVVGPEEFPANPGHRFGMGKPVNPEIGKIIKCAYFKYQTNKVFFRTSQSVRDSIRRKKQASKSRTPKINKIIVCPPPTRCINCGSTNLHSDGNRRYAKRIFDLRYSQSGVRRWVVRYETKRYRCRMCRGTCVSDIYPKHGGSLGHGLASWAVHAHVALRQSFEDVSSGINETFGYSFHGAILDRIKPRLAKKYGPTKELLLNKLRGANVLYADETKVMVHGKAGYVWAFTNLQEVVYLFHAARDGTVLQRVIDGFKGVLVSDFYGIYDAPECEQQKCVIHFIRDLNDDLMLYPFDEELADLASGFTRLFTPIIATIDKYGLKQKHLNPHRKPAEEYLARIEACQYRSKHAIGYQRRLKKYGARLFTFLTHDGVSWNNNAAENAIKLFASRRRIIGAAFTEAGIDDYLLFLGIHCTLRRKGGSLQKFLRSREMDIDKFLRMKLR